LPLVAFAGAVAAGGPRADGGARRRQRASDVRLLVTAGVVVGAFANAGVMVALANAPRIRCAGRSGG
jgi:hypothetical protein